MRVNSVSIWMMLVITACTSVPLTSLPKLLALKPETMDIAEIEMAVRVADDIRLHQDGAKLFFAFKPPDPAEQREEVFTLLPVKGPLPPYLQRQEKDGFYILRFKANPDDIQRFNQFRAEVIQLRAAHPDGKRSSFFTNASGCLAQGANPFQKLPIKLYLRTSLQEAYFPVIREQRIPVAKKGSKEGEGWRYCTKEDAARL